MGISYDNNSIPLGIQVQSGIDRIRGTMHRKYTTMKKAISVYGRQHRAVDRDPSNPDFQTIASRYGGQAYDPERSRARMQKREEKLRARESNGFGAESPRPNTMRTPGIIKY